VSARAVPFHCPYCGDENLFPHEVEEGSSPGASHGAWECRSCLRAFKVSMIGQLRRPATGSSSGGPAQGGVR
jgi:transposase-like protein